MPTPRVFISYSHDSAAHSHFVLSLANKLRQGGLDCCIDQYVNGFPAEGWPHWMEMQVEAADFVLLVCTPDYLKRFRGRERDGGRGVTFEGLVISQSLYDHYYQNTKFVPVIPDSGSMSDVPMPLKGFGAFRVMAEYEKVYRFLTGQPEVVVPEVGDFKTFTPTSLPEGEGLKIKAVGDQSDTKQEERGMRDTMKAVWIGGVFVLLGAIITGMFALLATPSNTTHGDNASIIIGNGNQVTNNGSAEGVSK